MRSQRHTRQAPPAFDADGTAELLHALRLKGFADTPAIAIAISYLNASYLDTDDLYTADGSAVESIGTALEQLAKAGVVKRVEGARAGWTLTPAGTKANDDSLANQLDISQCRSTIESLYIRFLTLNGHLLELCTRWQVSDPATQIVNDHSDPDYDGVVIDELRALHRHLAPIVAGLAAALGRFAAYGPRLASALAAVEAGDHVWFAKPTIDSYHTVWFELHEDLLATLGKDRAAEAAVATKLAKHG